MSYKQSHYSPFYGLNSHRVVQLNLFSTLFNLVSYKTVIALALIFLLATPLVRESLEQYMLTHVLIQLPLLVICGMCIADDMVEQTKFTIAYQYSLPLVAIALVTAMIWMLPRMLDISLEHSSYVWAKFISLPFLLGLPLRLGWRNVGPITKAFIITNILSMLIVLAWLYIEAPTRLCNYYLIDEQHNLGISLIYISGLVSLYWIAKLFKV